MEGDATSGPVSSSLVLGQNVSSILNVLEEESISTLESFSQWLDDPEAPMEPWSTHMPRISSESFSRFIKTHGKLLQKFVENHFQPATVGHSPKNMTAAEVDFEVEECLREVYFSPTFVLSDQDLFEACETPEDASALFQQLLVFLDKVEVCILDRVNSRSDNFFATLKNLQTLQISVEGFLVDVQSQCFRIKKLKNRITPALTVLRRGRRRKRLFEVLDVLDEIRKVKRTTREIGVLIDGGEFKSALTLIRNTNLVLDGRLKRVICLQPTRRQLDDFQRLISDTMCSHFVRDAARLSGEEDISDEAIMCGKASINPDEGLLGPLKSLLVLGSLLDGLGQYHKRMTTDVKNVIVTVVATALNTTCTPGMDVSDIKIKQIRELPFPEFLYLLKLLFLHILRLLRRIAVVHKSVVVVLDFAGLQPGKVTPPPTLSTERGSDPFALDKSRRRLEELSNSVLRNSLQLSQRILKRILNVRRELHAPLDRSDIVTLSDTVTEFETSARHYCGGFGAMLLKEEALAQAKANLEEHGKFILSELQSVMHADSWRQFRVRTAQQDCLNQLLDAHLLERFASSVDHTDDGEEVEEVLSVVVSASHGGFLVVEGEQFAVVQSLVTCLELIRKSMGYLIAFKSLAVQVLQQVLLLVEEFNTQAMELILGAKARQTASLRSITAKHLSLVSRSLDVLMTALRYLRTVFASFLPPEQAGLLKKFQVVNGALTDHQAKIFDKLVSIVRELVNRSCASLSEDLWESKDASEEQSVASKPREYAVDIAKAIGLLKKVLSALLTESQTSDIMARIAVVICERLPVHFETVSPQRLSDEGRQRWVRTVGELMDCRLLGDILHIVVCLRGLCSTADATDRLERIFVAKFGCDY